MKILITGGAGFIGTNATAFFSKNKNNQITIVDNFSRLGVKKNAAFIKTNYPKTKIIKTDYKKINSYINEIKKTDIIIHLAGQTAVTTSIENPKFDFDNNLLGSFNLLETVRKNNQKSVLIFSSTNKVYGDLENHRLKKNLKEKKYEDLCHPQGIDENEKLDFISPYGCSKGATDLYFIDYARIYGLKTVVFRQSCIYGPHQLGVEDQGWIAHFTKQFLFKKPLTIFGDGYQVRDLLYVEDLIKAYELAIEKIKIVKGQAINVGGGKNNAYSLLNVIKIIENKIGYKIGINFSSPRIGDQKYFVSSNFKAKKVLNWQPEIDFKNGINKLINWQRENL